MSLTAFEDSFLLNGALTRILTESSNPHQLWYQGASLPYPTAPGSHSHPFDAVKNHLGVWSCSCGPVQGSLPPPRSRNPDHLSVLSWTWERQSLCFMDLQVYELVCSLIVLILLLSANVLGTASKKMFFWHCLSCHYPVPHKFGQLVQLL